METDARHDNSEGRFLTILRSMLGTIALFFFGNFLFYTGV